MMHGAEKSDPVIVAGKPANKAEQPAAERSAGEPNAAERVEPRAGTKGNAGQQSRCRTQRRASLSQELERIRQVARKRRKERFTALFHHISIELLAEAFFELKKDAAPGVDRLTWQDYEADFERNIEDLHHRVHWGAYRALPSRRVYIPKPDGRQRPICSPMDPFAQILELTLKVYLVVRPCQPIHTGCSVLLKFEERLFEQFDADMVEERGELLLLPFLRDFPYAFQRL